MQQAMRNDRIDTVRGIACILLVAYHAIGMDDGSGLRLPEGSWPHVVNDFLSYFRMPLFTFLSGLVYAYRPVSSPNIPKFLEGKVLRLLVPLLFVGLVTAVLRAFVPGVNFKVDLANIGLELLYPNSHLWFIEALFIVFLFVVVLERFAAFATFRRALVVFALSVAWFTLRYDLPTFFSFNRSAYLLPFFLAGMMLQRFQGERQRSLVLLLFPILFILLVGLVLGNLELAERGIELLAGISSAMAMVLLMVRIEWLSMIGAYSYTIYLYHPYGTAGTRVGLNIVGIENPAIIFPIAVVVGIILPIVIHMMLHRVPYISRMFLGVRAGKSTGRITDRQQA